MKITLSALIPLLLSFFSSLQAEERMLLACFNQLIEINRNGDVLKIYENAEEFGINDAWKCPDGSIFYTHRKGVVWMDQNGKPFLKHDAKKSEAGMEVNGCTPYQAGESFAFIDSSVPEIRVINRSGKILSQTPLPLVSQKAHGRYRTLRLSKQDKAFWVCQVLTRKLLKVQENTGNIIDTIDLSTYLTPPIKSTKLFGVTDLGKDGLLCTTGPGKHLIHLDLNKKVKTIKQYSDLELNCRYFLGTQQLDNGHILMALGDYHMKSVEEVEDILVELDANKNVIWKLERKKLIDSICGYYDKKTGYEELRITNVHHYNHLDPSKSLSALK